MNQFIKSLSNNEKHFVFSDLTDQQIYIYRNVINGYKSKIQSEKRARSQTLIWSSSCDL